MTTALDTLNPFRYRGYVYDEETGLYYLRSRYYNPEWGRFINADALLGQAGRLLDHNLFSYCLNNPIMHTDVSGTTSILIGISLKELVLGISSIVVSTVLQAWSNSRSRDRSHYSTITALEDIPIAQPTTMAYARDIALSNTYDAEMGSEYYKAFLSANDGYLYKSGKAMGFREAWLWVSFVAQVNNFNKNYKKNQWGLYTPTQETAEGMAVWAWGWQLPIGSTSDPEELIYPSPEIHGINYYGHYHDPKHKYHIWFGLPIP